jgi:hypothetical protein
MIQFFLGCFTNLVFENFLLQFPEHAPFRFCSNEPMMREDRIPEEINAPVKRTDESFLGMQPQVQAFFEK